MAIPSTSRLPFAGRASVLVLIALGACGGSGDLSAGGGAGASDTGVTPTPAPVTLRGIGPIQAGMTVADARAVVQTFDLPVDADSAGCTYATVSGLPSGVSVMVEHGRIARVEVDSSNVPTLEGIRVGDSEAHVKAVYGDRVTVSPHKYTDGHYLTVSPREQADSAFRLVFETDGKRVTTFRAGTLPQVEYVEGCG